MSRTGAAAPNVVLASASPRRLDLLRMFGLVPEVRPADVDETPLAGEKPAELVERLCREKAEAVSRSIDVPSGSDRATVVIAADTVIDLDGSILAKPVDEAEAASMLRALSGRSHDVVTGMAVVERRAGTEAVEVGVDRTTVWVKTLTEDEVSWYVATGEPMGKAGAYAIQGLGSVLIDRIEGSYQGVVGLSLRRLDDLLRSLGLSLGLFRAGTEDGDRR